jgi:voltage-gated potassium channel
VPRPHRSSSLVLSFLHELYEGESRRASRFRYGLLAFDLVTIAYVVATSFVESGPGLEVVDAVIGLLVLADIVARLAISRRPIRALLTPLGLTDVAVIVSFLAPIGGHGLGFLRVLRTLRLFRSYRTVRRLKSDFPFVRRRYEVIVAVTHISIFLFSMTAIVYETQHWRNPGIRDYVDALYFTVTTLTTTGYGDITLVGRDGRLLSVAMMLVGISLFVRLVQVLFRAPRAQSKCPACGLRRHEVDAVHCRLCGTRLPDAADHRIDTRGR